MRSLLRALATLHTRGVALDLAAVDAPYPRRRVSLPPYPFERERHWLDLPRSFPSTESSSSPSHTGFEPVAASSSPAQPSSSHPLITRMRVHRVLESGIAPAAGLDTSEREPQDAAG
jgi:acyl transferase domain-containing protein